MNHDPDVQVRGFGHSEQADSDTLCAITLKPFATANPVQFLHPRDGHT